MGSVKLHQLIATGNDVKRSGETAITAAYQGMQKAANFYGFSRTYAPLKEDDIVYPPEGRKMLSDTDDLLKLISEAFAKQINVQGTLDMGNTIAKADIVVNGNTIATGVPVTSLLWLEKKLVGMRAVISAIPVLDETKSWSFDEGQGRYVTEPTQSIKTKKTEWTEVVVPGTDKHPAQTRDRVKDVAEGTWTLLEWSKATTATKKREYSRRLEELIAAVKSAREQANSVVVEDFHFGNTLTGYLFG